MLETFTIIPVLGSKTGVPANDASLFVPAGENAALTHDTGGVNVDYTRTRNTCRKSLGKSCFSSVATTTTQYCLGLFNMDGTNWVFMGNGGSLGRVFKYGGSKVPTRIHDGSSSEYGGGTADLYSIIRYGDYLVFADNANHTPYKVQNSDANLSKLILSGTEYKFKYLETFQRRIIGASSTQTNGDIEIRWTDPLPAMGSLDFPSGNQLYKEDDDPITGIKRMSRNVCMLYGENTIDQIAYYSQAATPFGIVNLIPDQGCTGHHSIVNMAGRHFFFNKNYGFCEYRGGQEFPYGGRPISEAIEDQVADITSAYHFGIVGSTVPGTHEIVWSVPLGGVSVPSHLLFYDTVKGDWRKKEIEASYVAPISTGDIPWEDLTEEVWSELTNQGLRWIDLYNINEKLAYSYNNGHVYIDKSEAMDGSDYSGYRVEPAIRLGGGRSLLSEIWFGLTEVGDYSLFCYHRSGNTIGELEASDWTLLEGLSCDSPAEPVIRLNKNSIFHQIKWGTDGKNEPFGVNKIEFKYTPQRTSY